MTKLKLLFRLNPITQISIGIVCLTASLLFIGELIGLIPNSQQAQYESRTRFAEAFAVQLSTLAYRGQNSTIENTLRAIVDQNDDLESAAIYSIGQDFEYGQHQKFWNSELTALNSRYQLSVPVVRNNIEWGTVQLRYTKTDTTSLRGLIAQHPTWALVIFVTVFGFIAYRFFMRRALRELDPSGAIPDRVKSAFDAMAEGVLILDDQRNVVLANQAFLSNIEQPAEELVGYPASKLGWQHDDDELLLEEKHLPWDEVFEDLSGRRGSRLILNTAQSGRVVFVVNCSPILDGDKNLRGVLTTFDDVSEMEEKNDRLKSMLGKLQISQQRIKAQNKELHALATRDPMTDCLNRRAFYEEFQKLFNKAVSTKGDLCAIMVDIDHFKFINDNHGHATGDIIIKLLAEILHANARECDLVARYGGEEFAVVVTDMSLEQAQEVAEKIRVDLKNSNARDHVDGRVITASLGVSSVLFGSETEDALLNEADQALYVAKEGGRDQVVGWHPELKEQANKAPVNNRSQSRPSDEPSADGAANDEHFDHDVSSVDNDQMTALRSRIRELEQLASDRELELDALLRYDKLTGLQQRDPFQETVATAVARGYRYERLTAVLSIVITSHRSISDRYGVEASDFLLQHCARRISAVIREHDAVAGGNNESSFAEVSRMHTDEFGVLVSDLDNHDSAVAALERIIEAISQPLEIQAGLSIEPECAVGISLFPLDASYAEEICRNAALARNAARDMGGKNNYFFFSEDLNGVDQQSA